MKEVKTTYQQLQEIKNSIKNMNNKIEALEGKIINHIEKENEDSIKNIFTNEQ